MWQMETIFFDKWENLWRILIAAPIVYIMVIVYIRFIGKRTTSQLNSFDWIVTVAIGSLVGSSIVLESVSIIGGLIAVLALIVFQYAITKLTYHFGFFRKWVQAAPRLLLYEGKFIDKNMERERVTKGEVYAAVRHRDILNINNVYAVVFETDASFSVLKMEEKETCFSLADVQGLPDDLEKDLKAAQSAGQ